MEQSGRIPRKPRYLYKFDEAVGLATATSPICTPTGLPASRSVHLLLLPPISDCVSFPNLKMAPKPIIVIVPGAFHRPSHYSLIIDPLVAQGFTVLALDLAVCGDEGVSPNATHFDDIKKIHELLLPKLDEGAEAIIMSHSYGSVPATGSVEGQTKEERAARGLKGGIVGTITISGVAFPVRGKNLFGGDEEWPPMPYHVLKVSRSHFVAGYSS